MKSHRARLAEAAVTRVQGLLRGDEPLTNELVNLSKNLPLLLRRHGAAVTLKYIAQLESEASEQATAAGQIDEALVQLDPARVFAPELNAAKLADVLDKASDAEYLGIASILRLHADVWRDVVVAFAEAKKLQPSPGARG